MLQASDWSSSLANGAQCHDTKYHAAFQQMFEEKYKMTSLNSLLMLTHSFSAYNPLRSFDTDKVVCSNSAGG